MEKRDVAAVSRTVEAMGPVLARQSRVIDQAIRSTAAAVEALPPTEDLRAAAAAVEVLPPMKTLWPMASFAEEFSRTMADVMRPKVSFTDELSRTMAQAMPPMGSITEELSRTMDEALRPMASISKAAKLGQMDGLVSVLDQAAEAAKLAQPDGLGSVLDQVVEASTFRLGEEWQGIHQRPGESTMAVVDDLPGSVLTLPVPSLPPVVLDSPWESGDPVAEPLMWPLADPAESTERLEISDDVLRRRCLDLLDAPGDFDRAVNQAMIVLEDRVRTMTGLPETMVGKALMNKAFGDDGPIILSSIPPEQDGSRLHFMGMYGMLRNPTGHRIVETYGREDAVAVVAYVDFLLRLLARNASGQ